MLMLAYEGGGWGHRLAYVSKFNKGYFKFSRIFCHHLNNWRMKFRLTKFSHYDILHCNLCKNLLDMLVRYKIEYISFFNYAYVDGGGEFMDGPL